METGDTQRNGVIESSTIVLMAETEEGAKALAGATFDRVFGAGGWTATYQGWKPFQTGGIPGDTKRGRFEFQAVRS